MAHGARRLTRCAVDSALTVNVHIAALATAIWEGDTIAARIARRALAPAEWLFAQAVARRNQGFDRAVPSAPVLAALSVGNLTVGGTGKTPVSAWCVQQLAGRGACPAVVLRGYGDDEWRVHSMLNPGSPVIVAPDRRDGVLTARVRGADCAVLDDAFQHRQVRRAADIVLVSADRWRPEVRLLPAGPFREPLESLRRAHVVVVTVKAASRDTVAAVSRAISQAAPNVPIAVIRLDPGTLRLAVTLPAAEEPTRRHRVPASLSHPAAWLQGRAVTVASAIGDPAAFEQQIRALGATVTSGLRYPDHHAFTAHDARGIATAARGSEGVVCTLKDAVKLASLWPREAPPLWYVSQTVVVERGAEALDRAFARVLAARAGTAPTAV